MLTSDSRATPGMPFGKLASGDPESLGFLSGVLRRQRRLIVRVVLIALAIGTLIFLFAPSSYKASATVLVDFKRLAVVDEESKSTGRIDSSALLSQIEVLNSTGVLERTVISEKLDTDPDFIGSPSMIRTLFAGLGLADDPEAEPMDVRRSRAIEALRKATSVERAELSYAITVTVTARSGEKAARLANALAQAYIDDQMDAKRLPSEKASAWFSERITQLQNDAIKAERAVTDYRLKNNIVTTDGHFIEEQRVFDLSQVALKARFARAGAEAKVAQINEMARTGGVQNALVDELSNIVIIQLRKAYADAKRQMADFTVRYGATHEATIKARAKMNELQSSLNDEVQRILEGARSDFAIAQIKEQSVQKELADLSERSLLALEARFQLAQLESASATVKTIRDTFMSRYVDGIQKQSFPMTEIRILTNAKVPTLRSFPKATKVFGGSLALGLGAGCLMAVAREAFSRRLRFRRQVETALGVPCLGFLPNVARAEPAALHPRGLRAAIGGFGLETLRSTKVRIDLRRQDRPVVIGVVSAAIGEGKSVVASSLAQLCAQSGAPTILVDANIRHPSLSDLLASGREAGLAEVVAQTAPIAAALRPTREPGLFFLPCFGKAAPDQPGAMLTAETLRFLFESLKTQYQYVVVELPAIGAVADAGAVADLIDGFLMVVQWDHTQTYTLDDAVRSNPEIRDKLVGSVMNRADLKRLVELGESSVVHSAAYHG